MPRRRIWEVDFNVVGQITIRSDISFRQEKGFDRHQFYSDIKLRKSTHGIKASITAYADSSTTAETVACVYFGRMIDVLAFENNIPITLFTYDGLNTKELNRLSRRQLDKSDFIEAFMIARRLETNDPKLLRSMGWYTKGKITENALDKFLAYWNVIEILASEYHSPIRRQNKGAKNQIYQCFIDYFGEVDQWSLPEQWIDNMYVKRNEIVHGGQDNTVEAINNYANLLPLLETTCYNLIQKIFNSNYRREDFQHLDF